MTQAFLRGGGEMGGRIRAHDWAASPLGTPDTWPENLRVAVGICLSSRMPMQVWWGRDLTLLYNDACIGRLGSAHPAILGRPAREAWREAWPRIAAALEHVRRSGEASASGELSFAPIHGSDGGVEGVLCTCEPAAASPFAERRMKALEASLAETHRLKSRFAAELDLMNRLHGLSMRLLHAPGLGAALEEALDAIMALQGADLGTFQLYDAASRKLRIAAQRGFAGAFLRHFEAVDANDTSSYGLALAADRRVMIEDVQRDVRFTPHLAQALQAGFRAVQSTPLHDTHGRVMGIVSTHFREPRHLDDRELRATDLFLTAVAPFVERKLEEQSLREADQRKDELLASIAHELRNPIMPLAAALESARTRYPSDAWLMKTVDMMDRQLTRVVRMVDDLTDMGRIKSGKVRLRRARIPLARVVDASLEQCRPAIESYRQELVVEQCDEPLIVDVDLYRMSQALTNILQNAAKYTEEGGRIVVSTWREQNVAAVSVADSGVGIAAADLPHVFDLFWQGGAHTSHARGGLGLGLSIVHSLLELHGGSITAESAGPGEGSRFTMRLPLSAAETAPVSPREKLAGLRVLIADDNVDAADALAALLRTEGFEVTTAHDGIDALDKAAETRPDAVLMDLGMPRMDGFEAAQRLRESHGTQVCIVALTGWGEEKDRERTRAAGFDGHLVKPVTVESLKELLATLRGNALSRSNAA